MAKIQKTFISSKYFSMLWSGTILMVLTALMGIADTLIAGILTNFADVPAVKSAFSAIRVCVCVLIFNSVLKLWKGAVKYKAAVVLFGLVLGLSLFFDISPVIFVVLCAVTGIVLNRMGVRGK